MQLTPMICLEVAYHEAIIRQAYKDSVGKWTWSVGMTNATGHHVERYVGNPQPLQHCLNIFVWALDRYADSVRKVFAGHDLTEAQFAAALSFHWNTGAIGKASWVKKWKAGDYDGAREAFMWYSSPPEIIGRRKKERDAFFESKFFNDGTMVEYTKLTSRKTPVWSSAVKINVREELELALRLHTEPALDSEPQPDEPVTAPTLTPNGAPKPASKDTQQNLGIAGTVLALLAAVKEAGIDLGPIGEIPAHYLIFGFAALAISVVALRVLERSR